MNQILFQKTLFFDFPNPSKSTKKIVQFKTQKLLLIAVKTLESQEKLAQKILTKTPKKWGIYSPQKNIAVGSRFCQKRPTGRPVGRPANGPFLTVGSYRSTGQSTAQIQRADFSASVDRSDTESKALWSGRPTGRLAHCASRRAQVCARRSTARSTGMACQHSSGSETGSEKQLNIFLKIL